MPVTRDGLLARRHRHHHAQGEPLQAAAYRQLATDAASQGRSSGAGQSRAGRRPGASRRLVTAQDERAMPAWNGILHDSAQQDHVALVIKARLAADHAADLLRRGRLDELRSDATGA